MHFENNEVTVNASYALQTEAPFEYVRKMRASVLVIGRLRVQVMQELHFRVDAQFIPDRLISI